MANFIGLFQRLVQIHFYREKNSELMVMDLSTSCIILAAIRLQSSLSDGGIQH